MNCLTFTDVIRSENNRTKIIEKITNTGNKVNTHKSIPTVEMTIGGVIYTVNGFFKNSGKTISEKFYGIMEKEVESPAVVRYNRDIPQESMAVGISRRA